MEDRRAPRQDPAGVRSPARRRSGRLLVRVGRSCTQRDLLVHRGDRGRRAPHLDGESPMIHENRILVTGSRTWFDTDTIREALLRHYFPSSILVSGACPTGADAIAERIWTELGGKGERHPANWGRYGRSAGHRRNHEMVALGATVCLAFILDHSPGSTGCVSAARLARIPVELHEVTSQQAGQASTRPTPARPTWRR